MICVFRKGVPGYSGSAGYIPCACSTTGYVFMVKVTQLNVMKCARTREGPLLHVFPNRA